MARLETERSALPGVGQPVPCFVGCNPLLPGVGDREKSSSGNLPNRRLLIDYGLCRRNYESSAYSQDDSIKGLLLACESLNVTYVYSTNYL
jgi:hypothetical protein